MCFTFWIFLERQKQCPSCTEEPCCHMHVGTCRIYATQCLLVFFGIVSRWVCLEALGNCSFGRLEFPGQIGFNIAASFMLALALVLLVSGYASYKALERGSFSASIHSTVICRNQGISRLSKLKLKAFD